MIDRESLAYKAGCDARIAGKRIYDNPYLTDPGRLWDAWRDGWRNKDYELRAAQRRH